MPRMHWRTHACANKHLDTRTCTRTDRRTDSNICPHARVHANTRMHALMNAGLYDQTGRTDRLTQTPSGTRACTHSNGSMLTPTHDTLRYIRTDGQTYAHMFVRGKYPSTNMEVRSKKLEVRSKKLEVRNKKCRACIDERTHVRTNIWTHEHACGQTNRQTDIRTDGRTDLHIRPHARAHAHTRTVACLHAHTMHSGTYAQTDRHTHTCSYGGKHPSTNMEVRS